MTQIPNPQRSNLQAATSFARKNSLRVAIVSVVVAIPCFWQPHVGFGDFPSHVYNAWLYPKVPAGELQGLATSGQHTNILSDVLLTWLIQHTGVEPAQRLVLSFAALLMFWGVFALIGSLRRKTEWWITPMIVMLGYGWAFQLGFLNSFIASALGIWLFALLWRGSRWDWLAAVPIAVLIYVASPWPLAWGAGIITFALFWSRMPKSRQWIWLPIGAVTLAAISFFLVSRWSGEWVRNDLLTISGADQFFIFRTRFYWLAVAIAALWTVIFVQQLRKPVPDSSAGSLPFHLYVLNAVAVVLLPFSIIPPGYTERFSFISPRLSLMAAAFACVCFAIDKPARWMRAAVWMLALLFFCFLYSDMRQLNKVEARVDELLRTIPPGQRVTALIYYPRARLRELHHMLDRECIGRCWSYGDYEPNSGQFRIRAIAPNPYVMWDTKDTAQLAQGQYIARKEDLPLYQIYPCGPRETDLCIRALQEGERTGAIDKLRHW